MAYNPKGNGTIERFNQTLIHLLRGACRDGDEWTSILDKVVAEYNMTPHSSTGYAPLELFLGRPMKMRRLLPDWNGQWNAQVGEIEVSKQDTEAGGETRGDVRSDMRKDASEKMRVARERSHRFANMDRVVNELHEGDLVYWKNPRKGVNASSKLSMAFKGPYHVRKVLGNGTVMIGIGTKGKMRRVAMDQLKVVSSDKKRGK